jgi:hypothetical protein
MQKPFAALARQSLLPHAAIGLSRHEGARASRAVAGALASMDGRRSRVIEETAAGGAAVMTDGFPAGLRVELPGLSPVALRRLFVTFAWLLVFLVLSTE